MNRRSIAVLALAAAGAVLAGAGSGSGPVIAQADPEPVLGSGSTFAEVALDQWATDVYTFEGLNVDFSGIGSVGGLTQFQQGTVDFASSDVPYADAAQPRAYAYLPIVAGGTALMYNVVDGGGNRITNLRLSPRTIANIFFGNIDTWDDPQIIAENPDLVGRLQGEIRRAVRTPGSGTTGVFTDFLSTAAPDLWGQWVGRSSSVTQAGGNYTTDWPASGNGYDCECTAFADSNGIANYLARDTPGSRGAIGYAETAYAIQLSLPVVAVRNESGLYRLPTARNVAVALLEATQNPDGTQYLENVHASPREEAYPISSYNYLVIPTADLAPGKGNTIGRYLVYSVTEGQAKADRLGYSPLPPNLVQFAFDRVGLINGAPPAPALGDWGRYYEALDAEVVVDVPEPPDLTGEVDPNAPADPNNPAADPNNPAADPNNPAADPNNPAADPNAPAADPNNPSAGAGGQPGGAGGAGATSATTTTIAGATGGTGAATPGALGPSGSGTTATSIAADGSIVYLDEDPLGAASGVGAVGLARGLAFEDGVLVSKDGVPVPEVETIGVGELLGIAGVLAGLIFLPPFIVWTIRRRQDPIAPPTT